jgi:hypothetical protein
MTFWFTRSAVVETLGNEDCHIILRGGKEPNYDAASVAAACAELAAAGQPPQLMIDASHSNSRKQHRLQIDVMHDVARQVAEGDKRIFGIIQSGDLGWGLSGWAAASYTNYDQFVGPGELEKQQYNGMIRKDFDNGDFISVAGHLNINRNNFYSGNNNSWRHNPDHRGSIAYRDNVSRERFAPNSRNAPAAAAARNADFRGHAPQAVNRVNDGGLNRQAPVLNRQPDVGNRAVQRDATPQINRPATAAPKRDAFQGLDAGRQQIDRGRVSQAAANHSGAQRPNRPHGGAGGVGGGRGGR